jgi:transposase-like protein
MSMNDEQKGQLNDEANPDGSGRRRFTAEQKVAILKEHLVEKTPVSQVCDKRGINPTAFYRWQKEFFENGAAAFEAGAPRADGRARQLEERIEKLTTKLARKDEVIAELMEDYVRVKKSLGEV